VGEIEREGGKGCWGFSGDGDQRVEVGLGAARIWRGERRGAVLEAERERGGGERMDWCKVFGGGCGLDDGFSLLIWLMRNMGEEGWFSLGFLEKGRWGRFWFLRFLFVCCRDK